MQVSSKIAFGASKSYTDESIAGAGAIKGKNCTITNISEVEGGMRVDFQWELDNGTIKTDYMIVPPGPQGEQGPKGDKGDKGDPGSGSQVEVTQIQSTGTKIAEIDVDGDTTELYAPEGGSGGAVDSVNGKTGVVVLNAEDVGALPDNTDIPDSTSDLTNDSGFITNTVNNLLNYYLKSETYTQAEVNALISAIVTLDIQAVSTLPTENISRTTLYLVPSSDPQTQNIKDEYINLDGTSSGWELIGSTEIDLTGYVTDTELTTALANYTTTANLTTLLANKADASDVDNIEALIPSTATSSNKLATMDDIGSGDFDDLTNRPQESETIDISELYLPMPAKPTEYPIGFDETGQEYQVSWYRRADGKVKPIWRKDIIETLPAQNTNKSISVSALNIEKVQRIIACINGNSTWNMGWHMGILDTYEEGLTRGLHIYKGLDEDDNGPLYLYYKGFDLGGQLCQISIEYTKTTDEWKEV